MPSDVVFACSRLLTPDRTIAPAVLRVTDGRVASVEAGDAPAGAEQLDGTVVPGLVDLQVNGFAGADVLSGDAEAVARISRSLLAVGVTAWMPTIVSASEDVRLRALDAVAAARGAPGARILGAHLEGPWISAARRGAHPSDVLEAPTPEAVARSLDRQPGLVRIVTLAPELPGALDAIAQVVASGAVASVGHTDAAYDEVIGAAAAGAGMATHLFNAMSPFHHREPSAVGAVLDDERLVAGLIADGVHVHPAAVHLAFRTKGHAGVALVSDTVSGGSADPPPDGIRLPDGTLAGSAAGLCVGIDVAVRSGVSLGHAVASATSVPARVVNVRHGRLEPLWPADFVVLDAAHRPTATYLGGEPAWP